MTEINWNEFRSRMKEFSESNVGENFNMSIQQNNGSDWLVKVSLEKGTQEITGKEFTVGFDKNVGKVLVSHFESGSWRPYCMAFENELEMSIAQYIWVCLG